MHGTRVCPPGKIVILYEKRYFVYVPQDFEFPECSETDLWLQLKCGQWKESSCPSPPPRIDCDSFTEFDRQSFKPPTDQPGRIVIVNGDSHITYIRKDCWIWRNPEDSMDIGARLEIRKNSASNWESRPRYYYPTVHGEAPAYVHRS